MSIDVTLDGNSRAYWDLIPTYPELVHTDSTSPTTSPSPRSSKEASELAKKHPKPSPDPARNYPDRPGLGGAWGALRPR